MIETYFETELGKLYNLDCMYVLPEVVNRLTLQV
jgi:hypothetical protein